MNLICVLAVVAVCAMGIPAGAEQWRVVDDDEWCKDRDFGDRYCEVREIRLEPTGDRVGVSAVNGGITVEGWDRDEIYIKARITLKAGSGGREDAERIELTTDVTDIRARGRLRKSWFRRLFGGDGYSVSYRVMVPETADIAIESVNGGLRVRSVNGSVDFGTTNGSAKLYDVGGEVAGGTTNGSITVSFSGSELGGGMNVSTTNGGITIALPEGFSAELDAKTVNGGIRVDHPVTIEKQGRHRLKGRLGDGGPVIKARTTNGGVKFKRYDPDELSMRTGRN